MRVFTVHLLVLILVGTACAAESLTNATGHQATGLRVAFSAAVTIQDHDTSLPIPSTTGKATEVTFSGGRVMPGGRFSLTWRPMSAEIVDYEWQSQRSKSDAVVVFADPALEAAVRDALPRSVGSVRGAELGSLTELYALGMGISDLSGLERAAALTGLNVSANEIVDLAPLRGLVGLTSLDLSENAVEDLSPLCGLIALESLSLTANYVTDVSPLISLPKLTKLKVGSNPIADLAPLAALKKLETLLLPGVGAQNLTFLTGLTALQTVDVSRNDVADLSPLSALHELTGIDVSDNRVTSLAPLAGLVGITWLSANGAGIADLSSLAQLTNLAWLSASANQIADISPLVNLTKLAGLNLSFNEIRDLAALSRLAALSMLWLDHNHVADLSPLSRLAALDTLWLEHNEISDVSPLAALKDLHYLDMSDNHIRDMGQLVGLQDLRWLDLAGNELTALSPLKGSGQLWYLGAAGNKIAALTGFPSELLTSESGTQTVGGGSFRFTCSYPTIDLSGNQITDLAALVKAMDGKTGHFIDLRGNPLNLAASSPVTEQLAALRGSQRAVCTGTLVTTEDFADGEGWYQGTEEGRAWEVAGGEYRVTLGPNRRSYVWNPSVGPFGDPFRASVDVDWQPGPAAVGGLAVSLSSEGAGWFFLLSTEGEASFFERDAEFGWRTIVDWTPCPASSLGSGTDNLTLTFDGSSVVCEVNGARAMEIPVADVWQSASEGYVGLYARNTSSAGDAAVTFDNLVIEELR